MTQYICHQCLGEYHTTEDHECRTAPYEDEVTQAIAREAKELDDTFRERKRHGEG